MSQNVEIVKRTVDAHNRRDVDGLAALTISDFELLPAMARTVESRGYRGREGIEAYFAEYGEAWEEQRLLAEEFRDLGDRVLVLGRTEGRGRGSGVQVDAPIGVIFDLHDGKISRIRAYLDHDEALRAAGVSE